MMDGISSSNLGQIAAEAQKGLAEATLIDKTLNLMNGSDLNSAGAVKTSSPGVEMIGETTKQLVNGVLGKGLTVDSQV